MNERSDGADGRTGYTGRTLVLLAANAGKDAYTEIENRAGIRLSSSDAFDPKESASEAAVARGNVCFDRIGVAVVESDPDQRARIASAVADGSSAILATEPERFVHALAKRGAQRAELIVPPGELEPVSALLPPYPPENTNRAAETRVTREFLRGYRAAVEHLEQLFSTETEPLDGPGELLTEPYAADATWGLVVTQVTGSRFSGRGVRLCVLDTGLDLRHPDFEGRNVVSRSFIAGEAVQDRQGHGTHTIGTALGPQRPAGGGPRYGVAYGAEIYAGKVLDDGGSGTDAGILAGIEWAVTSGCAVVSMSLGAPVSPGESYSQVFEAAARRSAARGTLIIAAAGNESARPRLIAPVGHPANCPSIMAVGAVDAQLRVAEFSNGGLVAGGGEVNIAAPGVAVLSAWPMPARYRTISGTSMATPHVAGIAALYAEASSERGMTLANTMLRRARRLTPARDFGWGLVQSI